MTKKKLPNPIDVSVGARVRLRRVTIGMTQEKLGDRLGITFQQVQKYEKGTNRIGASRLQQIAAILEVPVSYFFEDVQDGSPQLDTLGGGALVTTEGAVASGSGTAVERVDNFGVARDSADFAKAFARIQDPRVRQRVLDLVQTLADTTR